MMNKSQHHDLLRLLKALAQEHRLTIVSLMGDRERMVGEIAEQLALSEPTVSHHIGKLREAGLLHLRMDGNKRFYRLNRKRVEGFKRYAAAIDSPVTEPKVEGNDGWIEALGWDDEAKKVLYTYTANGRLQQIPRKEKKLLVVLRWLATLFQSGARYSENEVSEILTAVHDDYAALRRYLVEYGFMHRERGGGDYWLAPENAGPEA
jgi:biotin operon repressor